MTKSFRVISVISGWIEIQHGQIVRCSSVFKWSLHLNYEVLVNWLRTKGDVRLEKFGTVTQT